MDWNNALSSLFTACQPAAAGDEIHVAQGIYRSSRSFRMPYECPAMSQQFEFKYGVYVKGGFAGCRSESPDVHDVDLYKTVLSGDLLDNDGDLHGADLQTDPNRIDNSPNVLYNPWFVDGFYIMGGNASGGNGGAL